MVPRRLLSSVLLAVSFLALGSSAECAAVPAGAGKESPRKAEWIFSLLPNFLQKNPPLELTVITETTEAGKKLPAVSPQHPAFFQIHTTGYKQIGEVSGGEHTLPPDELEQILLRSLAVSGYLPAQLPAQPPSLVVVYGWGSHSMLVEGDVENPVYSGEQVVSNILDRAALVGGAKFAKELLAMFVEADAMNSAANTQLASGGAPPLSPGMLTFANPVNLFKLRDAKNELLLNQAAGNVYYIVASAYDYRSVTEGKQILLWRTRMTVAANGISQAQGLPTLLAAAGPYFGKEMASPELLSKRAVREGNVEIGTPRVIGPTAPAAPPTKE
ncbi:MAG: hypothetical protein ABIZ81_01070 [Opitutaceae bacterium]